VETLRRWRGVDKSQFHRVRLVCFEACKFHHGWRSLEYTIGPNSVIFKLFSNCNPFICLRLCDYAPLDLYDILSIWGNSCQRCNLISLTCGIVRQ
jgi:hypothetical protein